MTSLVRFAHYPYSLILLLYSNLEKKRSQVLNLREGGVVFIRHNANQEED